MDLLNYHANNYLKQFGLVVSNDMMIVLSSLFMLNNINYKMLTKFQNI